MQVASNMTPAEQASYELFKKQRAEKQAENALAETQRLEHQATAEARRQASRLNEIHTAKKDYACECCGKTIPIGTQYRRQNIPIGYGFMEGTHYSHRITHLICSKEAKQ